MCSYLLLEGLALKVMRPGPSAFGLVEEAQEDC